jgi:catechol 2,3-dioxygenase-like lactoylglutathione lyase family enzyme
MGAMERTHPGIELFLTELKVADWPRALRWYVDVLGLRPVLEDAEHQYALLEAGTGRVALKGGGVPGSGVGPGRDAVRLVFRVEDLEAARAWLLARGVDVGALVEDRRERFRAVRLSDPEGTPIRLFCWTKDRQ